jgi:diguanylate cyclase (GGDEF)-like protein
MRVLVISVLSIFLSACGQKVDSSRIDLSGEWKFQKGDSLEWRAPNFDDSSWPKIKIPGDLIDQIGDHGEIKGWLRTTYTIAGKRDLPEALALGVVGDCDEIYIDGVLIGKTGQFPPETKLAIHKYRSYLMPPSALQSGTHTLAIRLYKWGGPGMGIVGSTPIIAEFYDSDHSGLFFKVLRSDVPFALGIFLLCMGGYLLLIYLTCKVERQYFYSAIACVGLMLYCLVDSWKLTDAFQLMPNSYVWGLAMSFICVCNYATFRFVRSASRKPISTMDKINFWIAVAFSVGFVFPQNGTDSNLMITIWMPQVFFTNTYVGILLYRNLKATKKISAAVLYISFMTLMVCVVHDVYGQIFKPYLMVWISYGYFAFCLGISFFLAQDYSGALVDRIVTRKLVEKSEILEEAIAKDVLTGLFSRDSFMKSFEAEINKARNEGTSLTLAIMDVDHFKFYNDNYGHPAGDRLLVSLGWIIQKWTRTSDSCGRLGGEEFGILLRKTSLSDGYRACERLRKNVETFPFEHGGKTGHVTVSIGLVSLSDKSPTKEAMYTQADIQLYAAKKLRNHIEPVILPVSRIYKQTRMKREEYQASA